MRVNVHTGDGSGLWRRVTAATRAPGPRGPSAGNGGSSTNPNWTRTEPSPIGTTKVELPGRPGVRHEEEPVTSLVQQPQVAILIAEGPTGMFREGRLRHPSEVRNSRSVELRMTLGST